MLCVNRPKAVDNLQPFQYESFNSCCQKMNLYCKENDIHQIRTIVFGTKILEGEWDRIVRIIQINCNDLDLHIYS